MERRLGKGLGSLLGTDTAGAGALELELTAIEPNPFQPRKSMDPSGLEELRDSIAAHGVLQPIVVRELEGRYQLVSGERRWRASRLAGLERIPAIVREVVEDSEMLELALVENVQRRDLDPIERARGFHALMQALGITQEAVAVKVGLKRATVANHLRLLELPSKAQDAVGRGLISMGHARALLGLPSHEEIEQLMEKCARLDLSVREVERIVRERAQRPTVEQTQTPAGRAAWMAQAERRVQDALGARVGIECDEQFRGKIQIEFSDKQQLNRILDSLAPLPEVR